MTIDARVLALLFITAGLTACAAAGPSLPADLQSEYDTPLYCEGEEQCEIYWERAQFHVSTNAGFKTQTASNVLIETYSPTGGSVKLGYKITREPLGGGRYHILTRAWCDNFLGCSPNHHLAIAKAKKYIRTGEKT